MAETTIFGQYPPASWDVPGAPKIVFPVERIDEAYNNRLVPHRRVYRDGARIDDTGGDPTGWDLTIGFYNAADHEEGVDGLLLYPDLLNSFCAACKIHETGTLTIPTVGPRRCRAESYRRSDTFSELDTASVVVRFLEDNEDDAAVAAFQAPSASSVASRYALEAIDASQLHGCTSEDLLSLTELAGELEELARAPVEMAAQMEGRAGNMAAAAARVQAAFAATGDRAHEDIETLLTDPTSSRAHRMLSRVRDTAHRAVADAYKHVGLPVSKTFDRNLSIFTIAASLGQDAEKLLPLNQHIPDLLNIKRGTPVRVFRS